MYCKYININCNVFVSGEPGIYDTVTVSYDRNQQLLLSCGSTAARVRNNCKCAYFEDLCCLSSGSHISSWMWSEHAPHYWAQCAVKTAISLRFALSQRISHQQQTSSTTSNARKYSILRVINTVKSTRCKWLNIKYEVNDTDSLHCSTTTAEAMPRMATYLYSQTQIGKLIIRFIAVHNTHVF